MSDDSEILDQIWSVFNKNGIQDSPQIVEHIAAMLTAESGAEAPPELEPYRRQPPPDITEKIRPLLMRAVSLSGVADFFNRHVLFQLHRMLPGGRCPTPRYIIDSMLRMADVRPHHSFADLACGSGGFLVGRERGDGMGETVGVEISPDWACLVWSNLVLHGLPASLDNIHVGDALLVCGPTGTLSERRFDRIAMAPAFGQKQGQALAESVVGINVGSWSHTVLAALALKKLALGGRAVTVVPSAFLSGSGSAERRYRQFLVDGGHLEGVVTLPEGAFLPYSALQTNLLLMRQSALGDEDAFWLLHAERDAYQGGRNRDLTRQPDWAQSDLPFAEGVVAGWAELREKAAGGGRRCPAVTAMPIKARPDQGNHSGVIIAARPAFSIKAIEFQVERKNSPAKLLVTIDRELSPKGESSKQFYSISLKTGSIKKIAASDKGSDFNAPVLLYSGQAPVHGAAITTDGRLLGVAISRKAISDRSYDLLPLSYLRDAGPTHADEPSSLPLGKVWKQQQVVRQHLDNLLSRLELSPLDGGEDLPVTLYDSPHLAEPFVPLSAQQQQIWDRVKLQVKRIDGEQLTAAPFNAATLLHGWPDSALPKIEQALGIFERMGLIVRVAAVDPESGKLERYYRLITRQNRWNPGGQGAGFKEGGEE